MTKLYKFLLDLIFPIECLSCQKEDIWLCSDCSQKIKRIKKESCPLCGFPTASWEFCDLHKKDFKLEKVISPFDYNDPLLQLAIKTYKYRFVKDLAEPLGHLLSLEAKKYFSLLQNPVLVPVPLHRRREKWRGFNQAELLARAISKELRLPVKKLLKRVRTTTPQVDLKKEKRLENVKDAFSFDSQEKIDLKNKTIILIDDVATTCTTLEECAKILYSNGARNIWGLVLARG